MNGVERPEEREGREFVRVVHLLLLLHVLLASLEKPVREIVRNKRREQRGREEERE